MRALWSGDISFGLVTIPAKLYSAVRDLTPSFHWIHTVCGTRVQTVRRCSHCDRDVPWDEIAKGFEVSGGKYARFSKEELAQAEKDEPKGTIEIVSFVTPEEVDLAYIEKSYWLGVGGKNPQSFNLLHTVLERTGRVALAKVAIRERTRLALVRPRGGLFSLDTMRYADELVDASGLDVPKGVKAPSDKELKLAETLVSQLSEKFHPERHPDEYRARVTELVARKVKSHGEGAMTTRRAAPAATDLSEILARSVATANRKRTAHANRGPTAKKAVTAHRAPRSHARAHAS